MLTMCLNYHGRIPVKTSLSSLEGACFRWVQGSEDVRSLLPSLSAHVSAWGQQVALLQLPHQLSAPTLPQRVPILLLLEANAHEAPQLFGAVLLFAYGGPVFGTRLLSNADRLGLVGIFAQPQHRLKLANLAAEHLVRHGAALVRLDFIVDGAMSAPETVLALMRARAACRQARQAHTDSSASWKITARTRPFDLPLYSQLDDTLIQLGKRTRRNLRLARRRCESDFAYVFEQHANLGMEEFLSLNRADSHGVSRRIAKWRFQTARGEEGFLSGLRTSDGVCMGLTGGRLLDGTVVVDWQMNASDFAAYSISLVMRSHLIEAFGHAGMQRLYFDGGTSHAMADHFAQRVVYQVEVRRHAWWLRFMERQMKRWLPGKAMTRTLFGAAPRTPRKTPGPL